MACASGFPSAAARVDAVGDRQAADVLAGANTHSVAACCIQTGDDASVFAEDLAGLFVDREPAERHHGAEVAFGTE